MNRCVGAFIALGAMLASQLAVATVTVGPGGSISLGQGRLLLAETDLRVDGSFDVAEGDVEAARDVVINGSLSIGAGRITAFGDWINAGSFLAGTGLVALVDQTSSIANMIGDSIFYDLAMTSDSGGSVVLESGSIQRAQNSLIITGVSAAPIQIESSVPPQIAQMVLDPGGLQDIEFVGVSNVHATGQPLAPDQTNQGGSGNALGWFGRGFEPLIIPTLSFTGLILLILLVCGVVAIRRPFVP